MRVLLTGITSFIGREIAKELLDRGHQVYGMARASSQRILYLDARIHILYCDINEIRNFDTTQLKEEIDIFIHLAWEGIGQKGRMDLEIQSRNMENTFYAIEIAAKLGCKRVLFTGSQAEYGITLERVNAGEYPADALITEETECRPISEYGKAKLEVLRKAQSLCKRWGMEYIHLRIFSIYGVGDHKTSLIYYCMQNSMEKEEIVLSSCKQLWNYLYVEDCARAISGLVECKYLSNSPIINIASQDTRVLRDFVKELMQTIGKEEIKVIFEERSPAKEGTVYLNPSIQKLQELINFKTRVDFQIGVKQIEKMYHLSGGVI